MEPSIARAIETFFDQFPAHVYPAGRILIHAYDHPAHVYQLREGRVKQYDISYRGDEVVLNLFKPPAFFPMSYAINRAESPHFFQAETNLVVKQAAASEAVAFLKREPEVLYDLLARVYRGTDGLLGRLVHLMGGSARSRLIYELLVQSRRFGREVAAGLVVPANESDLASQAGLARETVNRELNKLKREGLIAVTPAGIVITSPERLAAGLSRDL